MTGLFLLTMINGIKLSMGCHDLTFDPVKKHTSMKQILQFFVVLFVLLIGPFMGEN